MGEFFKKFLTMFYEQGGPEVWSSTRFAFIFSVVLSNIVFFVGIMYLIFVTEKLPDIPDGLIWLYGAANGIAFAGKVVQRFKEGKNDEA